MSLVDFIIIGINLMHSLLLKGEGPPVCRPCDELLTGEHNYCTVFVVLILSKQENDISQLGDQGCCLRT